MKLSKSICKMIADIEFLIGSECYNPNTYDGWNDIEGCDYRYPINVPNKDGHYTKIRLNINETSLISSEDITPGTVKYMKYKFGANELFVGLGIIKVLQYLEERYGLDFDELEQSKGK